MKTLYWTVGIFLGVLLAFGILQTAASERVEVVQLHTVDEAGETKTTRLWIVDDEGFAYLRGDESSGWVSRIRSSEEFQLTRGGETASYTFRLRPDKVEKLNRLMQEKYTWGDTVIDALIGGRTEALAIELHPAESS